MADTINIRIDGENKTGNAFGGVEKSMDDLRGAAGNLHERALKPLASFMSTTLKAATAGLVAGVGGLVAVIGGSVSKSMAMEQQLADISAAMGTSADETAKLKKLINDLGFDPKLKVSATESADAIQMLGTAGLNVDQIMDGAARSVILLSNATGADMSQAAAIATDAMSLWNMEAKDMGKAVNNIVGVTLESKQSIDDYALALGNGAKGAVAAGVSFDQFNEMLVATASNFTSGMTQGTALTAMLLNLTPGTQKAKDVMKELGIITAEGRNRFFDMNGQVVSNTEMSKILQQTLGKLSTEQRLLAVDTLFGRDALAMVNGMINQTDESWGKYSKSLAETDAETQAAIRMDTLSGAMEIFWGVIESLQLQIGDAFIPGLEALAENFTSLASIYGPRVVEMFQAFGEQLAAVIQYLIAVAIDGDRMNDWLTHMTPEVRSAVLATLDFVDSLKSVVANVISFIDWIGGMKTVLIAVGALMAISVVAQVVTFVAGIISAVSAVVGFVGALGGAGAALAGVLAAIGPVIAIVAALGAAAYGLYVAWQNNFLGIRDITANVLDWIRGVFANFPQTLANLRDGFFSWASNAMGAVREGFLSAQNTVRNGLDMVMDFIQRGRDERLGPFAQSLFSAGQTAFNKLGEGFRAAGGAVTGEFNRIMTDVQNQGAAFAAGAFAGRMYEAARAALLRFGEGLRSAAPNLGSDMQNALGGMINVFNQIMDGFRNHVGGVMTAIGGRIKEALSGLNLGGVMAGALNGIIDGFNQVMDGFRNHVWSVMTGIGGRIADGLASGIKNGMGRVMDALNWIASVAPGWVRDALGIHSPSTVFADIGQNIMAGLAEGIAGATAMPEMALVGATGGMMAAPVTSTVNRNVTNNYQITNQGTTQSGDAIEQVRALRSMYGGAR